MLKHKQFLNKCYNKIKIYSLKLILLKGEINLNILVCAKMVPNTTQMSIDPVTNRLVRHGVNSLLNPADACALEKALKLKDSYGATVTIITMGNEDAKKILLDGMAAGADDCFLITDSLFGGSDTYSTAHILASVVKYLKEKENKEFDIILCGTKTIDGETAQTGPELAEQVGYSQVTSVIEILLVGKKIWAKQETDDYFNWLEMDFPTLLTIVNNDDKLRTPTLKKKREFEKIEVEILNFDKLKEFLNAEEIGLKGSPTKVLKSYTPSSARKNHIINGDTYEEKAHSLIKSLKEEGVI